MHVYQFKQSVREPIVDYNRMMSVLSEYAHPRGKVSAWLKSGDLVRVKKGLYIFGAHVEDRPYSIEQLANLIYGPSAVSLNYALSYYGIIPETVHIVTSITNKRDKQFETPVGDFSYRYLNPVKYAIGINLIESKDTGGFLMASPEKALCDVVALMDKSIMVKSLADAAVLVFDDLRCDEEAIFSLDFRLLDQIARCYQFSHLTQFVNQLYRLKVNHE